MRCNARISIGKSGHAETYCQRDNGHPGEHSINREPRPTRCAAIQGSSQCEQPAGHIGSHASGGAVKVLWQ